MTAHQAEAAGATPTGAPARDGAGGAVTPVALSAGPASPVRKPQRIQRKRTKGWRMPEGAVYVGRPSVFANPFRVGDWVEKESPLAAYFDIPGGWDFLSKVMIPNSTIAVECFTAWAMEYPPLMASLPDIRGKDLACWCPLGFVCHADVLLEWANP